MFENSSAILENMVFIQLRRKTDEIHYYRTNADYEIDFVTGTEGNLSLYQVSADISDPDTKNRELRAIHAACSELHCASATLIVECETETVQLENCRVEIVNAADWLRENEK